MPANGKAGREAQAKARAKAAKQSPSSPLIQPAAIPPMAADEYVRLKCLEIASVNSSRVGMADPFQLATRYAAYVLTGDPFAE
jgi:hypothetical protein